MTEEQEEKKFRPGDEVFRIEAGENLPRLYTADALARAVGSTLDELLER